MGQRRVGIVAFCADVFNDVLLEAYGPPSTPVAERTMSSADTGGKWHLHTTTDVLRSTIYVVVAHYDTLSSSEADARESRVHNYADLAFAGHIMKVTGKTCVTQTPHRHT